MESALQAERVVRELEVQKSSYRRVESTRTGPRKKETLVPGRGKESLEGSRVPRKERLNKEYDFDVDETESIFRELVKHDKIKLPPCKRPSEEGKSADPKDCPFHRVPGHPMSVR